MQGRKLKFATGAALVVGIVAGGTGFTALSDAHALTPVVVGPDTTPATLSQAFRRAAERAQPGVVHIQVEAVRQAGARMPELPESFRDSPFGDMFRRGVPQQQQPQPPRQGSGSGFIFRADGYVLTNNHVVDGAERVTVVLPDNREFDARVIGRDPNTDVAVVKIEGEKLPVVQLGKSDGIEVGDWVLALGYPLQLGTTATAGIVSAKGRSIGILRRDEQASAPLEHFIQTDAAINPGNSGGPLVDLEGRVIGMNSAIASPTGYYSGYGFAIPIELARHVAEDLIRYGEVRRPKLGVGVSDVTPADAEVYKLDSPAGAEVTQVTAGSPADRAGVRMGDVVVAVSGAPVTTGGQLTEMLARHEPGETVALDIVRYGERLRVNVALGAFEAAARTERAPVTAREGQLSRLGFGATNLTPALARQLETNATSGVVVSEVDPSGPAARSGIARGLVIERFNGAEITTVRELENASRAVKPHQAVSLVVRLPDGNRTIVNYRVRG
jgi:serine protease Do